MKCSHLNKYFDNSITSRSHYAYFPLDYTICNVNIQIKFVIKTIMNIHIGKAQLVSGVETHFFSINIRRTTSISVFLDCASQLLCYDSHPPWKCYIITPCILGNACLRVDCLPNEATSLLQQISRTMRMSRYISHRPSLTVRARKMTILKCSVLVTWLNNTIAWSLYANPRYVGLPSSINRIYIFTFVFISNSIMKHQQ